MVRLLRLVPLDLLYQYPWHLSDLLVLSLLPDLVPLLSLSHLLLLLRLFHLLVPEVLVVPEHPGYR